MTLTRDAPEFIILKGPDFSGPFIIIFNMAIATPNDCCMYSDDKVIVNLNTMKNMYSSY